MSGKMRADECGCARGAGARGAAAVTPVPGLSRAERTPICPTRRFGQCGIQVLVALIGATFLAIPKPAPATRLGHRPVRPRAQLNPLSCSPGDSVPGSLRRKNRRYHLRRPHGRQPRQIDPLLRNARIHPRHTHRFILATGRGTEPSLRHQRRANPLGENGVQQQRLGQAVRGLPVPVAGNRARQPGRLHALGTRAPVTSVS